MVVKAVVKRRATDLGAEESEDVTSLRVSSAHVNSFQ